MKLLSVVVPMYNVEAYIDQCLCSLAIEELAEELEVLVVNDGSTDRSREKAKAYEKRWPQIFRIVDKENGGHGSAINRGIREASGRYLKVVDGDDRVSGKPFVHLAAFLRNSRADLILSNYCWLDDKTGKQSPEVKDICPGVLRGIEYPFSEIANQVFLKMHEITYRTEILKETPPLDEHCYYVDMEYLLFPLPRIKTAAVLPDMVYQYRVGLPGQSVSPQKMRERCGQHEFVLDRLLYFYGTISDPAARAAAARLIARMAVSQYKIYLSFPDSHKARLAELEDRLKRDYPEIYNAVSNRAVWLLRRTGYKVYGAASLALRMKQGLR